MIKSLISGLLLIGTAQAQNITITGPFSGLNNTDSSITIANSEAQDILNVEPSKDGLALKKRKGYAAYAALAIATSPVRGGIAFKNASGNNIKLYAHDIFVSASSNGGVFSNIINIFSGNEFYCGHFSNGKRSCYKNYTRKK